MRGFSYETDPYSHKIVQADSLQPTASISRARRGFWQARAVHLERPGAVQVMDAERLQGRRFDVVVVSGLSAGVFPRQGEDAFSAPSVDRLFVSVGAEPPGRGGQAPASLTCTGRSSHVCRHNPRSRHRGTARSPFPEQAHRAGRPVLVDDQ